MKFLLSILATLLLATVMPTTAQEPVYKFGYMGVFYNLTLKATLRDLFYTTNILGNSDNSSKSVSYDHTTIFYEPTQAQLNEYNPRLGEKQSQHILGYAMDEHGQALLVSYDGPNAIQTNNSFPHVTISSSGSNGGLYAAVYSNDLWARVAASGFVNITNDSYGKPSTISWNLTAIADSSLIVNGTYNFTLSQYTAGIKTYAPTLASVTLFEPTIGGLLEGTFCASRSMNFTTGVCNTTPVILPTSSSSSAVPANNSTNSSSSSSSSSASVFNISSSSSSASVFNISSSSSSASVFNISSSSTGVSSTGGSSTGSTTGSSASMITSSFTITTGIVSTMCALLFL